MSLTLSLELPNWAPAVWSDDGKTVAPAPEGVARWGAPKHDLDRVPPALGDIIMVGGWGPAVVSAYFVEEGWLGVRSTLLAPSAEWFHGRKPGSEHTPCSFGTEFEPAPTPDTPTALRLTWRDHPEGPAFRIYGLTSLKAGQALEKLLESAGFKYDGNHACWVASRYRQGDANAYALAARLRWAGYAPTHDGFYGEAGPPSDGLRPWW